MQFKIKRKTKETDRQMETERFSLIIPVHTVLLV